MNKRDAAKYLNVSERAINRYTSKGRLPVTYRERKQGSKEGVYDVADLKRLKQEMNAPPVPRVIAPRESKALTRRDATDNGLTSSAVSALVRIAESAMNTAPAVPLRDKLTLTLDDAMEFCSGYSRGYLLEAIRAGKLKAIKRRGWVIKRADLDAWIKKR
jgi:hypothetical protein